MTSWAMTLRWKLQDDLPVHIDMTRVPMVAATHTLRWPVRWHSRTEIPSSIRLFFKQRRKHGPNQTGSIQA